MNDSPHESGSVRPPSTGDFPASPTPGPRPPAERNGPNRSIVAVVALSLLAIVAGGAAIVLVDGGDSDDETIAEAPTGGDAGSTGQPVTTEPDATDPATSEPKTAITEASSVADTTVPDTTLPPPTTDPATQVEELDEAPEPAPEPTAPPTAAPAPVAPVPAQVAPATITASIVRPGGEDSCIPPNPTSYEPALAQDGTVDTAWMAPGDGVGQRLVFTFPSAVTITELGLFPGYGKFDPCTSDDRFVQLRRIQSVQWTFDDGSAVDQSFTTAKVVQTVTVEPRVSRTVTLTVVSTIEPGMPRLDHTPISEVVIG